MLQPGVELKAELRRLDEHFSAMPKEVLDRGLISFDPPLEGDFLTTRLWKRFLPGWKAEPRQPRKADPVRDAQLMEKFSADRNGPIGPPVGVDEADFVLIERAYPFTMGKYRIFPPEVEEREKARRAEARAKKDAEVSADVD